MEVKIRTNKCRAAASEINSITAALRRSESVIEGISNNLALSSDEYQAIRTNLKKTRKALNDSCRGCGTLGSVLTQISHEYEKAEKKIQDYKIIKLKNWIIKLLKEMHYQPGRKPWPGPNEANPGAASRGAGHSSLEFDILKPEYSAKYGAEMFDKEGNFNPYLKAYGKAEISALKAKGEYSNGFLFGEAVVAAGTLAAKGEAGATLFDKNGKLDPSVKLKAKAEATALEGKASAGIGNEKNNIKAEAEGKLLTAEAEASVTVDKNGAELKAGAEAYVAQGSVESSISILGIKIGLKATGGAGGAGATASAKVGPKSASGEIGAGLGLGLNLQLSIEWGGSEASSSSKSGSYGKGYSGGGGGGGGGSGR